MRKNGIFGQYVSILIFFGFWTITEADQRDGLTRILTFPLNLTDNSIRIKGLEPGASAVECLTGGIDAGVVNGALKIGIGFGLASGCGKAKQPKMVPVPLPVFISRPFPVAVAIPQPYPVPVVRPMAIRVPQPVPFPAFNLGPVVGPMLQFPHRSMTGYAS